MPPPEREDIVSLVKVSKDNTKAQVKLTNGRFEWLPISKLPKRLVSGEPPVYHDPTVVDINREAFLRPEPDAGVVRSTPIVGGSPPHEVPIKNIPDKPKSPPQGKQSQFKIPDVHVPDAMKIKGGKLTEAEIAKYGPDFPAAFDEICVLVDKLIGHTTKGPVKPVVVIWSNIDDADTQILVDMFLSLGRTDPRVAVFVRASVTFYRQARIIEILAPRFIKTWEHYMMFGFEMPGNKAFRQKIRQQQR